MPKYQLRCGLDIGSSQVIAVAGKYIPDKDFLEIIDGERCECRNGLREGKVIDIDAAASAISEAIGNLEEKVKKIIKSVYLAIRGSYIVVSFSDERRQITSADKEIAYDDINSAIESNRSSEPLAAGEEIFLAFPVLFVVDGQKGIINPIGMEANYLETRVCLVKGLSSHLSNIYRSITKAGFAVEATIYGLLALGKNVVYPQESDAGCLLIDFGGQSMGLVGYLGGDIKFCKELPFGSDFITRDLVYFFHVSFETANKLKEEFGAAMPSMLNENCEIEVTLMDRRKKKRVVNFDIADRISYRMEELIGRIQEDSDFKRYREYFSAGGIILTGGGSLLNGCPESFEKILEMPTRLGVPFSVYGNEDIILHPSYATAISVMKYDPYRFLRKVHKRKSIWKSLSDFFFK